MKHFIKKRIQRFALLCAGWLRNKTEQLTPVKKKTGLILFCIFFIGISVYIVAQAVLTYHPPGNTVIVQRIYPPSHIGKTLDRPLSKSFISAEVYQKIESVKTNDSLLRARPHLIDSIQLIEQLYQLQSKK